MAKERRRVTPLLDFVWNKVVPKKDHNRFIAERNDFVNTKKWLSRLETPEAQAKGLEFFNWLREELGHE